MGWRLLGTRRSRAAPTAETALGQEGNCKHHERKLRRLAALPEGDIVLHPARLREETRGLLRESPRDQDVWPLRYDASLLTER